MIAFNMILFSTVRKKLKIKKKIVSIILSTLTIYYEAKIQAISSYIEQ